MEKTARFSCLTGHSYDESLSKCVVVIMAAGSGVRFGETTPKQYNLINDKAILRHTVERFLSFVEKSNIRIVINEDHLSFYNDAIAELCLDHDPIFGGKDRQESVYNGLKSFQDIDDTTAILIHDAVRPFFAIEDVASLVSTLNGGAVAACLARPITDTLKYDGQTQAGAYVDRSNLWSLQTPQGFHYKTIMDAHDAGKAINVTDDTALVQHQGHEVVFLESTAHNLKITYPEDLILAKYYAFLFFVVQTM